MAGDEEAFGELVSRHRPSMVRIATAIVGPGRAEDVVQDSLLTAYRALPSLQDRRRFPRWLAAITRFRALNLWRSDQRHASGRVPLDDSLLETLPESSRAPRPGEEGDELLLATLEKIPPEFAEVVRLHFLHGLPHQKIAEAFDLPVGTVRWRCFRGKELLREALSDRPRSSTRCDRASCLVGRPGGLALREGADPCPCCPAGRSSG